MIRLYDGRANVRTACDRYGKIKQNIKTLVYQNELNYDDRINLGYAVR